MVELAAEDEQLVGDPRSRVQPPEQRPHGVPDHRAARQLVVDRLRCLLRDLLRNETGLGVEPAAERGPAEAIIVGRLPEPEPAVLASHRHRRAYTSGAGPPHVTRVTGEADRRFRTGNA